MDSVTRSLPPQSGVSERNEMKQVNYRLPDTGQTVLASVLCATGESTLLFVPGSGTERPDSLVIAHDDDLDGVYEDTEMNWFNVEESDVVEISMNLAKVAKKG